MPTSYNSRVRWYHIDRYQDRHLQDTLSGSAAHRFEARQVLLRTEPFRYAMRNKVFPVQF